MAETYSPIAAFQQAYGAQLLADINAAKEARAAELDQLAKQAQQQALGYNEAMNPYRIQQAQQSIYQGEQAAQANQAKIDQQTRQAEYYDNLGALFDGGANPSLAEMNALNAKFPEFAGATSEALSAVAAPMKKAATSALSQAYSVMTNGDTEGAMKILADFADAAEQAGDAGAAQAARSARGMAQINPDGARAAIGSLLSIMDPRTADNVMGRTGIQRTDPIGDGSVAIQYMKDGSTRLVDVTTREVLTGQAAKDAFARAQSGEIDQRSGIKGGETTAGIEARIAGAGEAQRLEGFGTAIGTAQAEAVVSAPSAVTAATNNINVVDQLLQNDRFAGATGALQGRVDITADQGALALLEQVRGAAFLEGVQGLEGYGAITEIEGQKAEQAIARLKRTQNVDDFRAALVELRGILSAGLSRQKAIAGGNLPYQTTTTERRGPMGSLGVFLGEGQ